MGGEMRYCPACKRGTFHTVKVERPWTLYTCRGGCKRTHKVSYS